MRNHFIFADSTKCVGCLSCELACAAAYAGISFEEAYTTKLPLISRNRVVKIDGKTASFNNGIFMGLSGSKWKRDENGEVILDWNTGMPTSDNLATYNVGNREPKLYGGIVNNFRYKNWTASIQLDYRIGGDIFNGTDYAMTVAGMSKRSMDRESITISGVSKNPVTGLNEPKSVTYQSGQFYNVSGGVQRYGNDIIREYYNTYLPLETSNFITNTNWLRLSSINVSYTIPESLLKRVKFIRRYY
jgi:hypothetical protein